MYPKFYTFLSILETMLVKTEVTNFHHELEKSGENGVQILFPKTVLFGYSGRSGC